MKMHEGRSTSFSIQKALDIVVLILIGATAVAFFIEIKTLQSPVEWKPLLDRITLALPLVISILLIPTILLQWIRSYRERGLRQEEPSLSLSSATTRQLRFLWKSGQKALIPSCIEFLEEHFTQFFSFHRFHNPYLFYYYFAKKGSMSLYAPSWIRMGLLIFFLSCYGSLAGFILLTPQEGVAMVLGILVCFWLPGILMLFFFPYQKLWLCWVEQGDSIQITVTIFSPFRRTRVEELSRSIESTFVELQRLPLQQTNRAS